MVELLISMTIMMIVMAVTVSLFTFLHRSFTSMEAGTVLPAATQQALNGMQNRIVENRRQFENTPVGALYLAKLPTLSPAPVSWRQLPVINVNMSLSISTGVFVSTCVGDSLFFASTYGTYSLSLDTTSATALVERVDTFVFNYYYLAESPSMAIAGKPVLELREWHSIPYADYQQLALISVGKSSTTVCALQTQKNVSVAWDSSSNTPATAFYMLSPTGGLVSEGSGYVLETATDRRLQPKPMIQIIEGAASGGFKYGVSRNGFSQKHQVPAYYNPTSWTGDFPGGMEVMIVGPASSRQVFVRLVMTAQGNFKGLMSFQNVLLSSARDLY